MSCNIGRQQAVTVTHTPTGAAVTITDATVRSVHKARIAALSLIRHAIIRETFVGPRRQFDYDDHDEGFNELMDGETDLPGRVK